MRTLVNILMLFAALLFASNIQAQVINLSRAGVTYGTHTGTVADTAKGTTAKNFDIFVGKDFLYYYSIELDVDSTTNGYDFGVQLSGSYDGTNFTSIGSEVWYGVTTSDTTINFSSIPTAETWTVAQHTISTAAAKDVHTGTLAGGNDTTSTGHIRTFTYTTDTNRIAARTATVAAQTYTINKDFPVGWRYLRIAFTGKNASSRCEIERITVAIRQD